MLTCPALEQTAALVEGKVTPQLASLLDTIKDEKKVSLAVADPKLGMVLHPTISSPSADHFESQRNQQTSPALSQTHIRFHDCGPLPSHPKPLTVTHTWSSPTKRFHHDLRSIALTIPAQAQVFT